VKNSKNCPKCRSSDIVRVPGDIRGYGAGNNITVGWTIFNAVKVTRYLCATCGFSEEWIDSPTDIAKVKAKYGSPTR
jgi:transposase-like protein